MIVWFEGENEGATRDLQGYIEFQRSHRQNVVIRFLLSAYWRPTTSSAKANYEYCAKGGNFVCIWSFERENKLGKISQRSMLSGLLNLSCVPQLKTTTEYKKKC